MRKELSNRSHIIDILKGICIIFVIITHLNWTNNERSIFIFPFCIEMAVPIFMILSGYNLAQSFIRKKIDNLAGGYQCDILIERCLRYTFPYLIVIIWEIIVPNIELSSHNIGYLLRWILDGTYGDGSYYYPILMQLIFVYPIIFLLIFRKKKSGLQICILMNALYELLKWAYFMNEECYRLLVFRYIFLIAIGTYVSLGNKLSKKENIIYILTGSSFIIISTWSEYEPKILTYWTSTSFISSMFVVPIIIHILQIDSIQFNLAEIIGKASYHIFLVQMVFYQGYFEVLEKMIESRCVLYLLSICICLITGVVFYYIERPISTILYKQISNVIT